MLLIQLSGARDLLQLSLNYALTLLHAINPLIPSTQPRSSPGATVALQATGNKEVKVGDGVQSP